MTQQAQIPATATIPAKAPFAWKLWTSFAVFMLLLIAGTFSVYWYNNLQTYHLAPVEIGVLYRDGNRDMREFKHTLTMTHAATVVSLIDEQELHNSEKPQFMQETNYCVANGIQYIRIPVTLGGWPSSDDLKNFFNIMSNKGNYPVLVHCAQGIRRTGMFVAAYQETSMHYTPQQAKDAILSFGHRARDTDDIRRFIDAYDPVKVSVPAITGTGAK